MSGEYNGIQRGIIPRSVEQILHRIEDMKVTGWKINCNLSIVELYNGTCMIIFWVVRIYTFK